MIKSFVTAKAVNMDLLPHTSGEDLCGSISEEPKTNGTMWFSSSWLMALPILALKSLSMYVVPRLLYRAYVSCSVSYLSLVSVLLPVAAGAYADMKLMARLVMPLGLVQ